MPKPKLSWWQRIKLKPFFIRLFNWEFWPMWVISFPTFFYWLYLSIRARSFFWFSATNPGIYTGGMIGESKREISAIVPDEYEPVTVFIAGDCSNEEALAQMKEAGLDFPVIVKPSRGQRGNGVRKITSVEELNAYNSTLVVEYLLQEFIDYSIEAGVMHYYYPDTEESGILSLTIKGFLTIVGDGESTWLELMQLNPRAVLVMDRLKKDYKDQLDKVLGKDEKVVLEGIGNHSRGTAFLARQELICDSMVKGFDVITKSIKGLYFCRYDLRCPSIEDLQHGRNIKIMEINGVGADPAHVFDPSVPMLEKYRIIFRQWKIMHQIARINHEKGAPYMTYKEVRTHMKGLKEHNKLLDRLG
ncbi:MAG: hypothetical protein GY810_30335 [Aureispira sp.]|nr:hypothetical protein [Aureispira sp.]